jgi:hypothetical protein
MCLLVVCYMLLCAACGEDTTHQSPLQQVKLLRQGERTLETLDAEEARFTDEMVAEQEAFMQQATGLQAVGAWLQPKACKCRSKVVLLSPLVTLKENCK